jgi:Uma2 family endonuclease
MATVTSKQPRGRNRSAPVAGLADRLHRFTVEEYRALPAAGLLAPDARVELLEGVIVDMTPIGPEHCFSVGQLMEWLMRLAGKGWHVRCQQPISDGNSEPQPDVTVVRGVARDYIDHHPGAGEVGLVLEVADSSLAIERGVKLRVYAAAGIPEYWIVHLAKRQIEVLRDPYPAKGRKPAGFRESFVVNRRGKLTLTLNSVPLGQIKVIDVMP